MAEQGISHGVVEQNGERVERILAISGDASEPAALIQAHIPRAGILVIAAPDAFACTQNA